MYAPHVAVHFVERWSAGHQRREVFVGRAPATAFNHKAVVLKRNAMRLKLADPAAMEGHHFLRALGNWQRDGEPVDLPRLRAQIRQAVTHYQHAAVIEGDFTGET
ncbi:hypothetical protein D3C80_1643700 [compost metagenome]